jgi:uncharacterized RDD family membrane protein YckC
MAEELAAGLRTRAERLDDALERFARRIVRRPFARDAGTTFAGLATRGAALVIDVVVVNALVIVGAGLLGLVSSLVGDLGPDTLVTALAATAWALVEAAYFVFFWTATGQTPGMRVVRLRVVGHDGEPPGVARSFVRLVGGILAIVPLFAGFVPVLFDRRRRALQDYLAGTVVLYADRAPQLDPAAEPIADQSRSAVSAGL